MRKMLLMVLRVFTGLASRFRNVYFRVLGVRMNGYAWLRGVEIPRNYSDIQLGKVSLDRGVVLLSSGEASDQPRILIEDGVYINRHTFLDASEHIRVKSGAMIGPFCYITDHDHAMSPDGVDSGGGLVGKPTVIGAKAWLGAHVTVLKGVAIGDGALIGAGSVVTKDVPGDCVAVGNPARVIKQLD